MIFNKTTKHRLYSISQGVIGPPDADADKIVHISLFGGKQIIEWSTFGIQEIATSDFQVQEFVEFELDWDRQVESAWTSLVKRRTHVLSGSPKFVLLTGLPGSGKTTFAKKLSSVTGWMHFDFSEFAYQVIGSHPLMQNDYTKIGFRIEKKIKEYISTGVSMIYDTTAISEEMRRHHFDIVSDICKSYLIYFPTSPQTCLNRVSLRQPASSIDLRKKIYRTSNSHVRTFQDFADEFYVPETYILGNSEIDLNKILAQLDVNV